MPVNSCHLHPTKCKKPSPSWAVRSSQPMVWVWVSFYFEAVCSSQWGSLYELKLVKPCTLYCAAIKSSLSALPYSALLLISKRAGEGRAAEWGRGLEEPGEPLLLALTWACVSMPLLVAFTFLVLVMLSGRSPNLKTRKKISLWGTGSRPSRAYCSPHLI